MRVKLPSRLLTLRLVSAGLALLLLAALLIWAMPRRVNLGGEGVGAEAVWDTSRLEALSVIWWQAILLAVLFVALTVAAWHTRGWLFEAATMSRFFAASLLIHALIVLLLWAVPLAQTVMERAEEIRVTQYAVPFLDDGREPVSDPGQQPYEKVADPTAAAPRPDVARQVIPADAGNPMDLPLPDLPPRGDRQVPPERILTVPLRTTPDVRQPSELPRQRPGSLAPAAVVEKLPDLPAPEARPEEKPLVSPKVTANRSEPAPVAPEMPQPPLPEDRPTEPLPRASAIDVKPVEPTRPTLRDPPPAPLVRAQRLPANPREVNPDSAKVEIPKPTEPDPRALDPKAAEVKLPATKSDPSGPQIPLPALPKTPGAEERPATTGPLSSRPLDALPRANPLEGRLPRQGADAGRVATIRDEPGEARFALRQGEARKEAVAQFGGSDASEQAVERGLAWLASVQNADGSWSLHRHEANFTSDMAGTGLALLPFLAAGHTHQAGKYQKNVDRGIKWLLDHQQKDGALRSPEDPKPLYAHALASIVLSEAHGMTRDAKLKAPAQKALDYIAATQHAQSGGWRYQPGQPSDTSVTGWQVMALRSGEMAGLKVPADVLTGARRWLASVETEKAPGGQFGYQSRTPTPAMTAQGLLSLQLLGTRRDDPRMKAGADYLLQNLPDPKKDTSYYWYHATQVMFHVQGKHWKEWNDRMRDLLVSTQGTQGPTAGSWTPVDAREKTGGRICSTALRLLILEVYYRHLPLYQQLKE